MNVSEILEQVESRRVILKTDGERILYRPREALPDDILDQLRDYRANIIQFLQSQKNSLKVFSKVLNRGITISWSGHDPKVVYVDRTPYATDEIGKLRDAKPEDVRAMHALKETFQGTITDEDEGHR